MDQQLFNPQRDPEIIPSKNSARSDFDFVIGKWKIHNRKLKTRLNNCDEWLEFDAAAEVFPILNGFGSFNEYHAKGDGFAIDAMALRLFNPKTRLWSIYWADSNLVVLDVGQVGSFDGHIGDFYARDIFQGKEIVVLNRWDKKNPDLPIWGQAFSVDNGTTWEWNWHMSFYRQT